jgi:hypothetical protein
VVVGAWFLHSLGIVCQTAWLGTVPAVLWAAWAARRAPLPPGFWVLGVYAVAVSLRWFALGVPGVVAAGPAVLIFCLLVRHQVARPPTRAGWVALAAFVLCSSLGPELRSLRRPASLEPVATVLGTVRLPADVARNVRFVQAELATAPEGGLFVAGGGPGWYLVSGRPNPTRFDAIWFGLGTTEPEAGRILADLRADPPAAILVEGDFRFPDTVAPAKIWAATGLPEDPRASTPDGRWQLHIADER